jgi:type IV pilus assembly protein PilA
MFCFKCGASMPDTSLACPQCSTPVSAAPPPPTSPPMAAAPAPAWQNMPRAQPYVAQPETDGKATASLILGILSVTCFSIIAGIPAVICGHMAHSNIRKSAGRLGGQGIATAGLIMGYLSMVLFIPVVLVMLAVTIPNLMRAKITANENGATSAIRSIQTAQIGYITDYPSAGFAHDLGTLGPGAGGTCASPGTQQHTCALDAILGCGSTWCTRNGYNFNLTSANCEANGVCANYVISAIPVAANTGRKRFCSTQDAVIRFQYGGPMTTPPTVEECQSWQIAD